MYKGKVIFVKNIAFDRKVTAKEIHTKIDQVIELPDEDFKMIENCGVSVYPSDKIPDFYKNQNFEWKLNIKTKDKRLLNIIQ